MLSVCIPTVNGSHRLERCLSHIFKDDSVSRLGIEVIVIDDGSSFDHLEANRRICLGCGVKLIENGNRRGVPYSWNRLIAESENDLILLLNDDIEVNRWWADSFIWTLQNNEGLGCLGFNAIEGPRPEIFPVFPTYMESNILTGTSVESGVISPRGFAFGFRKWLWEKIGGFDERYFCFFEEVDFALQATKEGYYSAILSFPILHHYHGETTRSVLEDPASVFNESKLKFEAKWGKGWESLREIYLSCSPCKPVNKREWNTNIGVWG